MVLFGVSGFRRQGNRDLAVKVANAMGQGIAGQADGFWNFNGPTVAIALFIVLDHALLEAKPVGRVFLLQSERAPPVAELLRRHAWLGVPGFRFGHTCLSSGMHWFHAAADGNARPFQVTEIT